MYPANIAIQQVESKRNFFSFRIALNVLNAKGLRNCHVLLVMARSLSSAKNVMESGMTLLVKNVEVLVKLSVVTVMGRVRLKAKVFS